MQIVKGLRIRVKERSTIHKLTFKCLHNIASDLFKSCFINYSHIYSTRRNDIHILIPKVRTESAQKGTFYTGAQAFNNLPPHQKEVDSIVIFKTQLNNLFFRVIIYVVIKFLVFIHRYCTQSTVHFLIVDVLITILSFNCYFQLPRAPIYNSFSGQVSLLPNA